ncbi:MAG: RidA family protein [Aigarchaeota archaeon]|nr:RidA family protein [Aigarchaeota archaeon]
MRVEKRLGELGLQLPPVQKPIASYVPAVKVGAFVFSSGQGPLVDGRPKYIGRLGEELTLEQGYEAARICTLNCLAAINAEVGSLDYVDRVVKVLGFVSSTEGFTEQSRVLNGASDLLVKIFGEKGRHARSAIGVNVLPMNIPVEVEIIVKLEKED